MKDIIAELAAATGNPILQLIVMCIVIDTIFGVLRAIKERSFNSNFGINGAIRKVGMLISIGCLALVDMIVHCNLIGFIPSEIRSYLPVDAVGTMEFFGLLYISYEIISILKNMALCGLPVKKIWKAIKKFLSKYTDELPDDEIDEPPEGPQASLNTDATNTH